MKPGQEIKPEDVNQLIRDGELFIDYRHGTELEFGKGETWHRGKLCGFSQSDILHFEANEDGDTDWCPRARFPLPALVDGDPVIVWSSGIKKRHRHFRRFHFDGRIATWANGETRWSSSDNCETFWDECETPQMAQLIAYGYTPEQAQAYLDRWSGKKNL